MDSVDIKDYSKQLEQVCVACRKASKCKDHTKLCLGKKLVFNFAKKRYKNKLKKGLDDNASS